MNIKLQDLTFDTVQQVFADDYARQYNKGVSFPNSSDSLTTVRDADDLERWKEPILRIYGDVELELNPDAKEWFNKVKILDDKFMADKNRYTNAKASWLDSERASGRSYGLDEIDLKRWAKLAGINENEEPQDELTDEEKAMIDRYEADKENSEMNDVDAAMYGGFGEGEGDEVGLDAQSLIGQYIDISQNVGMSGRMPRTAQDVIDIMPNFKNPNLGIAVLGTEDPGTVRWGHGIYLVQPDGTLKGIRSDYDTSG